MRPRADIKRVVRLILGTVLLADVLLLGVVWQAAAEHPESAGRRLEQFREEDRQIAADVRRAAAIREELPQVKKQCDGFLQENLRRSSDGYSAMVAELEKIAADAGLPPGTVSFRQKPPDKQGIIEVQVTAGVEGSYAALVKFVNGLERSKNLYLVDNLSLTAGHERVIHMNLLLRTYFRG
jgi:Tfp pilus assembly protein PilO